MLFQRRHITVFGSSSLALVDPSMITRVDLHSPVSRGDLERLRSQPPSAVLILDGLFGTSLAVSPAECRELLEAGWLVVGASSMGALRASELWSVGMIGIGDIFNLFRIGVLRSDADVAVVLDAVTFRELTLSMVHIRSLLADAERNQLISAALARLMLSAARYVYWADRTWAECKAAWQSLDVPETALHHIENAMRNPLLHPKARDGRLAIETLLTYRWVPYH